MDTATPDQPSVGRPTDYCEDLASQICSLLAEGISLRTVCLDEKMPHKATVFRWLARHPEFRDQYTRAKEESADAMAEDVLDIADDGSNDYMTVRDQKSGKEYQVLNKEHVMRSRLRVDTRKFLMAKMQPKKYGEASILVKNQTLDKNGAPTDPVAADPILAAALALFEKAKPQKDGD